MGGGNKASGAEFLCLISSEIHAIAIKKWNNEGNHLCQLSIVKQNLMIESIKNRLRGITKPKPFSAPTFPTSCRTFPWWTNEFNDDVLLSGSH
jgi:hypothetical protein